MRHIVSHGWCCVLLAACSCLVLSCGGERKETPAAHAAHAVASGPRFLALGDSYTIGESVSAAERWPVQLAERLRKRNVPVADPVIIAKTGWTTDELAAALDREKPQGPFALVTLLIGVNNQYRGRHVEEYRKQFVDLLQRAVVLADGKPERVLVLSIPDWGVTPFAQKRDPERIAEQIDRFNAVNREETTRAGSKYVDITPGSRKAKDDAGLIAPDLLHPSGKMYGEWAEAALAEAEAILKGQ